MAVFVRRRLLWIVVFLIYLSRHENGGSCCHGLATSSQPKKTPRSNNPPTNPSPHYPKINKYYTYPTFKRFGVPAILYSTVARAVGKLFFWRRDVMVPALSLQEKVCIVTGSNTGVGFETASSLVHDHGMTVILACRDETKGQQACLNIMNQNTSTTGMGVTGKAIFCAPLDLSNLTSVRHFCTELQERYPFIDVLVNNAGRNSATPPLTTMSSTDDNIANNNNNTALDGLFATNFLGHFLLTNLLLLSNQQQQQQPNQKVQNPRQMRVVNLSSVMHHFPTVTRQQPPPQQGASDDDEGNSNNIEATAFWRSVATEPPSSDNGPLRKTYAPSKLAALLFSTELNRRYASSFVQSVAVNPGAVASDIWRNHPVYMQTLFRKLYLTPQQGSSTSVAAATLSFDENDTGAAGDDVYLQPYALPMRSTTKSPPFPLFEMLGPYRGYRLTPPRLPSDGGVQAAKSLFEVCEELTGCTFPER